MYVSVVYFSGARKYGGILCLLFIHVLVKSYLYCELNDDGLVVELVNEKSSLQKSR